MPVSGREIASLDFANLIGGPLNAVVEAQAKSAITTANFIKEVGFGKDGKVVNVDFTYNRKNDNGSDQEFTLTLPFITMLPIPYITVNSAEIEFNAKITSTTESKTDSNFSQQVDASAGGNYWFVSAKVTSKTAYQKSSSASDREERTFDMRVRVEAKNQDMPAGTERILTLLENAIEEKTNHKLLSVGVSVSDQADKVLSIDGPDVASLKQNQKFRYDDVEYTISAITPAVKAAAAVPAGPNNTPPAQPAKTAAPAKLTLDVAPPATIVGKTINIPRMLP